jgi:DNA mismatch repair protein MutL
VLAPPPLTAPLWERALRREEAPRPPPFAPPGADAAERAALTPQETLPVLRVIGQYGNTYIIAEGPQGMYLIDQHAAHERVLYERFCAARSARRPQAQGLLEPLVVEAAPRLRAALAAEGAALAGHGFEIAPFGEAAFAVRALPAALARGEVREEVQRFLDGLLEEEEGDRRDRVAMSLACHGAIRAGKQLAAEEMRELVRQLEAAASPHTCPHGRPTMVHVSAEMLARGFGRR